MTENLIWISVAIIALLTALVRFLPFAVFRGDKKTPAIVEKLGKALPGAIMGMLVVYCLKAMSFSNYSSFLPQIISCAVVIVLYVWKRHTLLSIVSGTVCYMLLVQLVF